MASILLYDLYEWLPLDAAATPKLCSPTLCLLYYKHYAAVKINNAISKFPRSYSDHVYDFKISKYTYLFKYQVFSIAKKADYYIRCMVICSKAICSNTVSADPLNLGHLQQNYLQLNHLQQLVCHLQHYYLQQVISGKIGHLQQK